jgi:hypothetical protein
LTVRFVLNNGETILKTIEVTEKTTQFNFDTIFPVVSVLLDPDCDLLFEVKASNLK